MRILELFGAFFLFMADVYDYIGAHAIWFLAGALIAFTVGFLFYWLPKAGHL